MGGIFSSPSPPPPPPPPSEEENQAEERKARLEDIERRRRGRNGTIHTSWSGALKPNEASANTAKDKLGE